MLFYIEKITKNCIRKTGHSKHGILDLKNNEGNELKQSKFLYA